MKKKTEKSLMKELEKLEKPIKKPKKEKMLFEITTSVENVQHIKSVLQNTFMNLIYIEGYLKNLIRMIDKNTKKIS